MSGLAAYERLPQEPVRLVKFLVNIGGLRDDTFSKRDATPRGRAAAARNPSDLRSIGAADYRGLIKARTGRTLDDAALTAWEAGYLRGQDRPTCDDLIDAIRHDLADEPIYSAHDERDVSAYLDAISRNAETDLYSAKFGVDANGIAHAAFWDTIAERHSAAGRPIMADSIRAASKPAKATAARSKVSAGVVAADRSKPSTAPRLPLKTASQMSPADLVAWRARHGLTQKTGAAALGLALVTMKFYEQGRNPVPKTVELLCRAIDKGFAPD